MNEAGWEKPQEISILAIATTLLINRWRVARWMFVGAVIAALFVFLRPALYRASTSFLPQGTETSRSGLASLAGQFGLSLPAGNQSLSPEFYSTLLKSRVLLQQIARDTLAVRELGGRRTPFLDLFDIPDGPVARREEQGVRTLRNLVGVSVARNTGVVELSVTTRWPSVSLAIATSLVDKVSNFNQQTRQGQAAAERRFVEGRLGVARAELRAAEDRLQAFLQTNREFARSPELNFQRDRLQRDVTLQQQVFTSLTQSLEEVRIREVRDTPVITVVEAPAVATLAEPRQRLTHLLLGLLLGGAFGAVLTLASEGIRRRRREGDPEAEEFVGTLGQVKGDVVGRVRRLGDRIRR
jgi:uncharacterized protein involved in exopolysaccharide biosynthesis